MHGRTGEHILMNSLPYPDLGRLFMIGLPGPRLDDSTIRLIRENRISSFILFKRNVEDPTQLSELCTALTTTCSEKGLPKPFISIDQEGGTVTRLPPPFTQFEDARSLANSDDPEDALNRYAATCADELLEIGINMNLAPVLDVCPSGRNLIMERRSLGQDPNKVAALGRLVIETFQEKGVAACGKHFPGLGAASLDPHFELPIVDHSLQTLESMDLIPFQAAINAGIAAIMTSHTIYKGLDPDTPATMSKKILTGLLRERLGFKDLIITDDLEMGAIEKNGFLEEAALTSFQAGADILLICHDHTKVILTYKRLETALANSEILPDRLQTSLERIERAGKRFL